MPTAPLQLRPPTLTDRESFLQAMAEFKKELPTWDFSLGLDGRRSFEQYVAKTEAWSRGEGLPPGFVPSGFYVGVVNGAVIGRVSIRFALNESLATVGGHIGYCVCASARRQGYATEMLRLALPICRLHGIEKALLTCDVDNIASRIVIERCGGIFESVIHPPTEEKAKRRYWISTK